MKHYAIEVKGKRKTWTFHLTDIDEKYLAEWRADGLRIDEYLPTLEAMTIRTATTGKVVRHGSKEEKRLRKAAQSDLTAVKFNRLARLLVKHG